MSGGRIRKHEKNFTIISNNALKDEFLSLKAKGLYAVIECYLSIPNWELYKDHLISTSKDGRDGFNSAWKELKDHGYLVQHKIKDNAGKWVYEYELMEERTIPIEEVKISKSKRTSKKKDVIEEGLSPDTENPCVVSEDNPDTENPCVGNPGVVNPPLYKEPLSKEEEVSTININISSSSNELVDNLHEQCVKRRIELSKSDIETLMTLYEPIIVARAINKLIWVASDKFIKCPRTYIQTILDNNVKPNQVVVNTPEKKNTFNNFEQRSYDFKDLERKLLGWDDDNLKG